MSASMAQRRPLVPPSCSQGKQTELHNPAGTSLRHSGREGGKEGGNSASGNNFSCFPIRRKGNCPCQGLPADLPKAGSRHSRVLGMAASLHSGARAERGNTSGPDRCFWSLDSAGLLLSSRFQLRVGKGKLLTNLPYQLLLPMGSAPPAE